MDYKQSLHMPKTDFPMRGNLPKREPDVLLKWENTSLYEQIMKRNVGKKSFMFHDGPPYANGNIHLGTALNKTLKDFIVKFKNMSGFYAPFVPGWDTHGLPIELKALKAIGVEGGAIPPVELRRHCKEFAYSHVKNQMAEFKRLGTIGNYANPYVTLRPEYEARQVEVFGKMAREGYMYKGLKPVYWCPDCNTALAEAEIEYENDPCKSIYVKFRVTDDKGIFAALGLDVSKIYFVIWTTTTWTIPGNLAICLGPEYNYTLVKVGDEYLIMADELVKTTMETAGITDYSTDGIFTGAELEGMCTRHPLYDRPSPIIVGDHVTLESGTGCVHTAPGYGVEDFEVCKKYDDIGIVVCVDSVGRQTAEAGKYEGLNTEEANKAIAEDLTANGAMLAMQEIVHQYPHCWRCHQPIIYRATEQWFCSVKGFKDEAIKAIEGVQWIPEWGEERIKGMVRDRSDWCISRQRTWGVPIPIVYCADCKKPIVTDETISSIADVFRKEGADAWWTKDTAELIPSDTTCECGCKSFTKEYDIMDVWFDSGVSHTAVLDQYEELTWPADLYLEGADQYRGWFQSALLTSVVYKGTAPYKQVCTHGWVVDGRGQKMSKSLGNGIEPHEIVEKYGADILRLWVASSDYHSDIRISNDILTQLSDAYKKIRNTARFILGSLSDGETAFDPNRDMIATEKLLDLDTWILTKLSALCDTVCESYESYDFHTVFHRVYQFCVVDLSSVYLDIIKDRLYCEKTDSLSRRAAQTTVYTILDTLVRLIAPILSFTAEEIWSYMPHRVGDNTESVFLNDIIKVQTPEVDATFVERWEKILTLRETVNAALEKKRAEKLIGKSLEASVTIHCENATIGDMVSLEDLAEILMVSNIAIVKEKAEETVEVKKTTCNRCERCWRFLPSVGENALCARCVAVLNG